MDNLSSEDNYNRFLQDINASGYVMANFFARNVFWVLKNAKFPIKAALRDAEAIHNTAIWLNKNGFVDIDKEKWSAVWLTREMGNLYAYENSSDAEQYFKQEKLDQPFTNVDSGSGGSIPIMLYRKKGLVSQSLFTRLGNLDQERKEILQTDTSFLKDININAYTNEPPSDYLDGETYLHNHIVNIIEKIPKEHRGFLKEDGFQKTKEGLLEPVLRKNNEAVVEQHHVFYSGLHDGLKDCMRQDMWKSNEKWDKYLQEFCNAVKSIYSTMDLAEYSADYFNPRKSVGENYGSRYLEGSAIIQQAKSKIQEIYNIKEREKSV